MPFLETVADPATLNLEQLAISLAALLTLALFALVVLDAVHPTWTRYPRRMTRYTVAHTRAAFQQAWGYAPRIAAFGLGALLITGVVTTVQAHRTGTTPPLARLLTLASN